ncbi:MAG: Kelch repeat-containing protein [Candidatus Bathyarchaeia archaeon]|jgi:N-acetylneuraminic acid mutarotase
MKRLGLVLLVLVSFLSSSLVLDVSASGDFWVSLASPPTPRVGLGVAVVDGKIFAIGGSNSSVRYLGTNEVYDPDTDTWETKASMPTPRRDFAIAVYDNKIYCISGESGLDSQGGVYSAVNEVYDPLTDTWTIKAEIPTPRYGMSANLVDGKIYVLGGGHHNVYPGNTCSDLNEVYDPLTDTWSTRSSLPTAVLYAASVVVDGEIYVLGGQAGWLLGGWYDFNQVYDVEADEWSVVESVPVGFERAAAGATTGDFASKKIYVMGGHVYGGSRSNFTQIFDPGTGGWSNGTQMPTPQIWFGVAVLDDELYAIGEVNHRYTPIDHEQPSPSSVPSQSAPTPEPSAFPLTWCIAAVLSVSVIGVGLLVYFKYRRKTAKN